MKQRTLNKKVSFDGIGVHTGLKADVTLYPAEIGTGIVFVNPLFPGKELKIGKVIPELAMHASVIKMENFVISTVEHLMAAISAFLIDNLIVEIKGVEVPILDGSSLSFVSEIQNVGIKEQAEEKLFLTPKQSLKFEDKEGRFIEILPAKIDNGRYDKKLYFDTFVDFDHPLIGKSRLKDTFSTNYFVKNISPARTFGFLEQLPFLRRHGLAKGTSLGNTVVLNEEEFLNDIRFEDEFARHKLLDLIGDLALLGKNLSGTVISKKTGHNFNRLIVEHYIKNPKEWNLI